MSSPARVSSQQRRKDVIIDLHQTSEQFPRHRGRSKIRQGQRFARLVSGASCGWTGQQLRGISEPERRRRENRRVSNRERFG